MQLYDYPRAPNPMRVNLFINEKKIKIERIHVDLSKHENLKPKFLKINPWGTVPFLLVKKQTIKQIKYDDANTHLCAYRVYLFSY